jgi:RimJ/RimL family protein N-acetyltransferase
LEIGWALRSEFHGQGYACEIGREGLVFAEEVLAGHALVSFTERHNSTSRRVMERIGMTYTGEILWRASSKSRWRSRMTRPFAVHVTDPG